MIDLALQGVGSTPAVPKTRIEPSCSAFARSVFRTVILGIMFLGAGLDYLVTTRGTSLGNRAHWLHRWSKRCARLLGMHFSRNGIAPLTGLVVANHLGYLDIIALSATTPSIFVAKNDVSRWPILGAFASIAGTIFIDRTHRHNVRQTAAELKAVLATGLVVVVFPEGTSSDGRDVLPFKSSLLQPACEGAIPVTAVAIDYSLAKGSVGNLVCYWGEMTLLPHLLKLLTLRRIGVLLSFGTAANLDSPRKALAVQLRQEIVALRKANTVI